MLLLMAWYFVHANLFGPLSPLLLSFFLAQPFFLLLLIIYKPDLFPCWLMRPDSNIPISLDSHFINRRLTVWYSLADVLTIHMENEAQ